MSLDSVYKECLKNILSLDIKTQKKYLEVCCSVRNMKPDILFKASAIFVPNDTYLLTYGGNEVLDDRNGLYRDGTCLWTENILFPFFDIGGTVVGFGGFNPRIYLTVHEQNDWSHNYYNYSTKDIMKKGNYLYMLPGTFERAWSDGYILITDGIFDTLSLEQSGFNAGALCGSSLTEQIIAQLRIFKKVIILSDNDAAGYTLENKMKKYLHNCIFFHQGLYKDADDILKSEYGDEFKQKLTECIHSPFLIDSFYRTKF